MWTATDCIETLLGVCEECSADMGVCSYDIIKDGVRIFEGDCSGGEPEILTGSKKMEAYLCLGKIGNSAWGKLYRTELFQEIRYPVGMLFEDVYPMHQLVHGARRIAVSRTVGYAYRLRMNSITRSVYSAQKLDWLTAKLQAVSFVKEHYEEFLPYAQSRIIDACVNLIQSMAFGKVRSRSDEARIQQLCREHFMTYIKYGRSLKVKVFAAIVCVHTGLAKAAARMYWKIRGSKPY